MLGKVAKGLGGVVFGGEQDQISDDRAVENLLQRVADGVLSEDRREALEHLRDLLAESTKAQSAVGAMGFPILCEVVREERRDVELVRAALDCLTTAFTAPAHAASTQSQEPQVVAINAELFSRDKQNVPMLLSLLEEPPTGVDDFHCRYHALQILTGLSSSLHRLQEAVLAYPMGVVRLMDIMAQREVVRNEALLLMIVLTHGNAEVQKIAAFEGAFERLFNIIREEGGADGGVIVQDCLQLTHGLLRKNASNQRMFRELGFVGHLPALLRLKQRGGTIARQHAANLVCALEVVRVLLAGDSGVISPALAASEAAGRATQEAMLKSGVVDILIGAPIGDHAISSTAVRIKCMECLQAILTVSASAKEKLLHAATTIRGQSTAALFALLQSALHRPLLQERLAAEAVLAAFCRGNPAGQAQLASTLVPSSKSGPSFGAELLSALAQGASGNNGTARAAAAARILAHLLTDCIPAKGNALAAQTPSGQQQDNGSAAPAALLSTCCLQAAAALAAGQPAAPAATALHSLLVVWCHDCEPAAAVLAAQAAHHRLLSDLVASRAQPGDTVATGLAAALLGVCFLSSHGGGGSTQQSGVFLGAMAAAGGAEAVLSALRSLQGDDAIRAASTEPQPLPPITRSLLASVLAVDNGGGLLRQGSAPGPAAAEPLLSPHLAHLVGRLLPLLEQQLPAAVAAQDTSSPQQPHLQPPGPQPPQPPSQWHTPLQQAAPAAVTGPVQHSTPAAPPGRELQQARATSRQLQGELAQLRMSSTSASQAAQQQQGGGRVAAAEARAAQAEAAAASLQQRLEESSGVVDGLRAELKAAAAEADAARSAAAKAESDMEDLANAFQGLESHAGQLEAELRQARAQAPSESPGTPAPASAGTPLAAGWSLH